MSKTTANLEKSQLQQFCVDNAFQAWVDVKADCPACQDYYPVVDTDGDLTGSIAHAADTDYCSYRGDVNNECVELVHDRLAADQEQIELALGQHLCTDNNPCGAMVDAAPGGQWRITDDWHTEVYCDTAAAIAAAKTWGG